MKYDDFLLIYNAGPEATYKLLLSMMDTSLKQSARIHQIEEQVEELQQRVNKNSSNSSKPPSSDNYVKPKSRRKKSGKKPGGQKGREGKTLEMSPNPDVTEVHRARECRNCARDLAGVAADSVDVRQVFDLPPQKITITEHRCETINCPDCDTINRVAFPSGVNMPVQYGTYIKSCLVYLNQYQLIPYKRTLELMEAFYGHRISEGTLYNSINSVYDALQPVEEKTIELLLDSPVNYADETGLRIEGKLQWMHVVCNENLTHYASHPKRGMDALEEIDVLPRYTGILVHDFWKPYFKLICTHGLCNAHHLRELTGIAELTEQKWPEELSELLVEIKNAVDGEKNKGASLSVEQQQSFSTRYDLLIEKGYQENPPPPEPVDKKRGRKKQSKARNLLDRLSENKCEALAFMYDHRVNFDNNMAEQAIRMVKVKQKISGVFRSEHGAKMFCRIRGYISMVRKNTLPILEAINDALTGSPYLPQQ